MRENYWRFATLFLLLSLSLVSCTGKTSVQTTIMLTASVAAAATETVLPTSEPTLTVTSTFTPTFTITPTKTLTPTPTETSIPEPVSLTGEIRLFDTVEQAFVTKIEIREDETFRLIGEGNTDISGVYNIYDVQPGVYELWILITEESSMVPGCDDIAPPDDTWRIGIKFEDGKALTMGHAYLSKALMLSEELKSPEFQTEGFYAVLPGFHILSGMQNILNVTLICK